MGNVIILMNSHSDCNESGVIPLSWYHLNASASVMKFVMRELWTIWSNKNEKDIPKLQERLQEFDFSEYDSAKGRLQVICPLKEVERQITAFLYTLYRWVRW